MQRRLTVEFTPVLRDWGCQIGWASVRLTGAFPGLTLNHMPVYRQADTRLIHFGSPLTPGNLPASRYSCLTFDTDRNRQRFLAQLDEALRVAHPELFLSEAGI
jgi:hypothetical protein